MQKCVKNSFNSVGHGGVLQFPCSIPQKWCAVDAEGSSGEWSRSCVSWVMETEIMATSHLEKLEAE